MRSVSVPIEPVGDIHVNLASFTRSLGATNLSPRTIQSYAESTELLAGFLAEHRMPTTAVAIQREHLEAFISSLLAAGTGFQSPDSASQGPLPTEANRRWAGGVQTPPCRRVARQGPGGRARRSTSLGPPAAHRDRRRTTAAGGSDAVSREANSRERLPRRRGRVRRVQPRRTGTSLLALSAKNRRPRSRAAWRCSRRPVPK
jgi:hypothetical protein